MLAFGGTAEEKLIRWERPGMKRDDAIQAHGQEAGTVAITPNEKRIRDDWMWDVFGMGMFLMPIDFMKRHTSILSTSW